MSSVDKVINDFDDRKEAVVPKPLSEKKSLTKDVDKGAGEMEYTKEAVVTIHGKDLDKFEGQYKGYTGQFKLESEFKTNPKFIQNSIKCFEEDIEVQDTELYKQFIVPFDKQYTKTKKCEKWNKVD